MVTIKLGNVKPVMDIMNLMMGSKLPVSTAYNVSKLARKLLQELKHYDELRVRICEKYCDKDENGKPAKEKTEAGEVYKFTENKTEFDKEMSELFDQDVEFDVRPLPVYALDGAELTPLQVNFISPFLQEE